MNINNFEYLIVLLLSLSVPFLLSFHPNSPIGKDLKKLLIVIPLVSIPWLVWDVWATSRGHWAFNSDYHLGFKILNLPIEEILFFWLIPYASIFLWTVIRDFTTFSDLWKKITTFKKL